MMVIAWFFGFECMNLWQKNKIQMVILYYLNNVLGSRVLICINCENSKFYGLWHYIVVLFYISAQNKFF